MLIVYFSEIHVDIKVFSLHNFDADDSEHRQPGDAYHVCAAKDNGRSTCLI